MSIYRCGKVCWKLRRSEVAFGGFLTIIFYREHRNINTYINNALQCQIFSCKVSILISHKPYSILQWWRNSKHWLFREISATNMKYFVNNDKVLHIVSLYLPPKMSLPPPPPCKVQISDTIFEHRNRKGFWSLRPSLF